MIIINQLNCQNYNQWKNNLNSSLKIQDLKFQIPEHEIHHKTRQSCTPMHSIFTTKQKIISYFIFIFWLLVFVDFIFWWFTKTRPTVIWAYYLTTISIMWLPVLSLYFFIFSMRQREVKIDLEILPCRVAFIVTKIASESEELLIRTLKKMKDQDFPYDVWIADEDPTDEMLGWCKLYNVNISTRKGEAGYHNESYPGKARTKEGNLKYFYDKFGYENYDFVSQFDADHAPEQSFLSEAIKYFNDPNIGYVSSPSITDGNLDDSWTVLARCHWESTTHGPIQSGSNLGFVPMMFGSHYTHRVKALKQIGGIAPEYAEDHTTTMVYNASGWKGAFARHAIAHGYGAVGLGDSMLQEYQWALVSVRALFFVTPMYFWKLPWQVKIQFIIWESWYPLLSVVTLISYFLPAVALKIKKSIVAVESYGFLWHYLLLLFIFIAYTIWLREIKHLRPKSSWQLSWETTIFQILQFPWILLGVLTGLWQVITRSQSGRIKITDKNEKVKDINFLFYAPHFFIIWINLFAILSSGYVGEAFGYYWFSLVVVIVHIISLITGIILTFKESMRFIEPRQRYSYIRKNQVTTFMTLVSMMLTFIAFYHIVYFSNQLF
jgi:cellulose synthase (UDP-forming)